MTNAAQKWVYSFGNSSCSKKHDRCGNYKCRQCYA